MENFEIVPIGKGDYDELSVMVGELLNEIMEKINARAFQYDAAETRQRAQDLVECGKYWVFIAKDISRNKGLGFVSLYESYALYSEGAYGTIPELYVRAEWRSQGIGKKLLSKAREFAQSKEWKRVEVTTPPLPEFEKTLEFYQQNEFEISGGRKLKTTIF